MGECFLDEFDCVLASVRCPAACRIDWARVPILLELSFKESPMNLSVLARDGAAANACKG